MNTSKTTLIATFAGAFLGGSYPTAHMILFIFRKQEGWPQAHTVAEAITRSMVAIPVFTIVGAVAGFLICRLLWMFCRRNGQSQDGVS
jgi:hypothetical protein